MASIASSSPALPPCSAPNSNPSRREPFRRPPIFVSSTKNFCWHAHRAAGEAAVIQPVEEDSFQPAPSLIFFTGSAAFSSKPISLWRGAAVHSSLISAVPLALMPKRSSGIPISSHLRPPADIASKKIFAIHPPPRPLPHRFPLPSPN